MSFVGDWKSWLMSDDSKLQHCFSQQNSKTHELISSLQKLPSKLDIPSPCIVVMGSQSSGKSTLINALMGIHMLPTSEEMCTKVPLNISLIPSEVGAGTNMCTVCVSSNIGSDKHHWEFDFTNSTLQATHVQEIQQTIQDISDKLVQCKGGDNSIPMIHMHIQFPNAISLSLVDLPGLTVTDRDDIHGIASSAERLHNIAMSMTAPKETAILSVMSARPDVEVDLAWKVLKAVDPTGERTAVVLTKADMLAPTALFEKMIETNGSGNVHAELGYYTVMLKNAQDVQSEQLFFESSPAYLAIQKRLPEKFGIYAVRSVVIGVADTLVTSMLSKIKEKLNAQHDEIMQRYRELGGSIDECAINDVTNPTVWLSHNIKHVHLALDQALRGHRGQNVSLGGGKIAIVLKSLRTDISSATPLTTAFSQIKDTLNDSNGIHLPETSIVTLLETVVQATDGNATGPRPTILHNCLYQIVAKHLDSVATIIFAVGDQICKEKLGNHRSVLIEQIRRLLSEVSDDCVAHCLTVFDQLVLSETSYVWSDCDDFRTAMQSGDLSGAITKYEKNVIGHIVYTVPKVVVHCMTTRFMNAFENALVEKLMQSTDICALVHEDDGVVEERKSLKQVLEHIQSCQRFL